MNKNFLTLEGRAGCRGLIHVSEPISVELEFASSENMVGVGELMEVGDVIVGKRMVMVRTGEIAAVVTRILSNRRVFKIGSAGRGTNSFAKFVCSMQCSPCCLALTILLLCKDMAFGIGESAYDIASQCSCNLHTWQLVRFINLKKIGHTGAA